MCGAPASFLCRHAVFRWSSTYSVVCHTCIATSGKHVDEAFACPRCYARWAWHPALRILNTAPYNPNQSFRGLFVSLSWVPVARR